MWWRRATYPLCLKGFTVKPVPLMFCNQLSPSSVSLGRRANPIHPHLWLIVSSDHCDAILKTDIKKLNEASSHSCVAESSSSSSSFDPMIVSVRLSVFQQIPGTLLVRGSLQQRDSPLSGAFLAVFQQVENFLKHKFCREKSLQFNPR
uniref:Uncharacterized protein n=1 Tax=Opuntia streptacantha TaxID=393608 RepID=A0A7C9FQL1_OPUST